MTDSLLVPHTGILIEIWWEATATSGRLMSRRDDETAVEICAQTGDYGHGLHVWPDGTLSALVQQADHSLQDWHCLDIALMTWGLIVTYA